MRYVADFRALAADGVGGEGLHDAVPFVLSSTSSPRRATACGQHPSAENESGSGRLRYCVHPYPVVSVGQDV
jgi:hypothetical protein